MSLLESINVPLGTHAADFSLRGTDGVYHTLSEYDEAKILVIIFMCNHCPYVQAIWDRLVLLDNKYRDRRVQFVGINPNYHPDYPEDSIDKMKEYAAKYKMEFPYLQDMTQDVAKEYMAQCTPDIYVFDAERKLAYHGRVDDNWKEPDSVTQYELDDAIAALLSGQKPAEKQNPSMGCSIKWQ